MVPRYRLMAKSGSKSQQITARSSGWTDIILICRKCSKKLDGGFGPDGAENLRKALRHALRGTKQRGRIGVMEVACFGVCPKNAVTMARGSRPGELLVVQAGTSTQIVLLSAPPQPDGDRPV